MQNGYDTCNFHCCTHTCMKRPKKYMHGSPSDQASLMPSDKATTTYVDRCAADDLEYSNSNRSSRCNIDMPRLLQLLISTRISICHYYFNYSSRLETSPGQVLNYSATSSARSTTSRNQLRLVVFVDKSSTNQRPSQRRRSHRASGGHCFRQLFGFGCSYGTYNK
jgi:hypothetical protein